MIAVGLIQSIKIHSFKVEIRKLPGKDNHNTGRNLRGEQLEIDRNIR